MFRSTGSTYVLAALVILVALFVMSTPAAAHPGVESIVDTTFATPGPPDDVYAQCPWWWPWC